MLIATGILLAAVLCCPMTALTIRSTAHWLPVHAMLAAPGGELRINWIHTVSNRPVSEVFSVDKENRLCLREMVFDDAGPGLPAYPEDETAWALHDGKIIVTGYDRCFERLHVGVSPIAHCLEMGNAACDLVSTVGPDRLIVIAVEQTPLFLILLARMR